MLNLLDLKILIIIDGIMKKMKDLLNKKISIDVEKLDIFTAGEDFSWGSVPILKDSLVVIKDKLIYVNETDLDFIHMLLHLYPQFEQFINAKRCLLLPHPSECNYHYTVDNELNNGCVEIKAGSLSRWNRDHFCYDGSPSKKSLEELPTFEYRGRTYSSWGYQISIATKEIEGGFYKKDGKFYEMVGQGMEDLEVK